MDKKNSMILDVGCGCGGSSEIIKKYESKNNVIGIDNNKQRIDIAKQNNKMGIEYLVGDATNLIFQEKYFDISFSRMLFEVCNQIEGVIDEMIRVTKVNGVIVIMGNLSTIPWIYPEPSYFGKYVLAEERLRQKMKRVISNPLEVINTLKHKKVHDISFVPYFKDSINCNREDLYNYYYEKKEIENSILVKSGLMKEREYDSYQKDLKKIMLNQDSIIMYSQYYIIAYICE